MTLLKIGNPNLTDPQGHSKAAQQTHAGQAYFGGTGPAGKTCSQCVYWIIQGNKDKTYHRKRVCKKGTGVRVPKIASACKYFEQERPS